MLLLTEDRKCSFARICGSFADAFGGRHVAFCDANGDAAYSAAVKDILGSDSLPYHDIAHADSLISFGSDFLSTWGNPTAYSVAYGKFRSDAHGHRGMHVHFGARYSMTAANADKWVPIAPGAEGYAAMAIAWGIADSHPESSYVQAITGEAGLGALRQFVPDANAQHPANPGRRAGRKIPQRVLPRSRPRLRGPPRPGHRRRRRGRRLQQRQVQRLRSP